MIPEKYIILQQKIYNATYIDIFLPTAHNKWDVQNAIVWKQKLLIQEP